jgi:hypothetical protein
MKYESKVTVESEACPGVRLTIRRMSFGRRLELTRSVKEVLGRLEFLSAGEQNLEQEAKATLLAAEIDRSYLEWGLEAIEGLEIDGQAATSETLLSQGPEELVSEAVALIRREAGLAEDEQKNLASHSISSTDARPDGNATNAAA